ncbi:nicotinamide mononucleotide transporter, partial [Enterococcus hirae]|nr:nicotinamide mononucleotide transporter [Enterococcus hirae]
MQNNSHSWLYNQLFLDWKKFEVIYCLGLITLQLLVYAIAPDSLVGMLSGVTGIMSLVYGMKGRRVAFIFGTIQCIAMTYIAWISHAYGSFSMDIIYVISQPIGWFMWGNDESVHQFSNKMRQLIFFGAFIAWLMGWFILSQVNG